MSTLSRKTLITTVLGLGALCWATLPGEQPPAPEAATAPAPVSSYRVSGPFTHENLTVFLLHGPDTLPPRPILTLDEALAKSTFVVHETGTVNTLTVENLSDDGDVLIQPGDIVKGGRQDRLIAAAMLVPARSGKIAVPSFCVEHGRWTQRGHEAAGNFAENKAAIAGKDLKTAALVDGQQGKVWENVEKLQTKLSRNAGQAVNAPESPTSLQLALENRAVEDRLTGYERALGSILRGSRSAVGYVIAVNGKVTGAEVFGSSAVLAKAWPKALRSAATEALAERDGKPFEPCTAEAAVAFLRDAEKGQAEQVAVAASPIPRELNAVGWNPATGGTADVIREVQDLLEPAPQNNAPPVLVQTGLPFRVDLNRARPDPVTSSDPVQPAPVQVNRVQGRQAVLVESRDRANPASVIHRSYIAK
jgi:hypothetical protein